MRFDVRFKGLNHSDFLENAVVEKFSKLIKLEIKPVTVQVTFRTEGHQKVCDVYIRGLNSPFRAQGAEESFLESLDDCVEKLWRQMSKEKSRVKNHKNREQSSLGRLEKQIKAERAQRKAA